MANRNWLSRKLRKAQKRKRRYMPSAMPQKRKVETRLSQPRYEVDASLTWYAVRTNIRCERRAELGLRREGFAVWKPIEVFETERRGRLVHRVSNLFVRYIFVGFGPDGRFDVLRETHGVEAVLGAAGCPLPIRPALLQAVANEIAGQEAKAVERGIFAVEQMVRILTGPFAGFVAPIGNIDQAKQRARVLPSIFGRITPVELDFIKLEAA